MYTGLHIDDGTLNTSHKGFINGDSFWVYNSDPNGTVLLSSIKLTLSNHAADADDDFGAQC